MKRGLQATSAPAQQTESHRDGPTCLAECGDSLSIRDVCAVLKISRAQYYRLKAHRAFPIHPLPGLSAIRYSKVAVQRYLDGSAHVGWLRRSA